MTTAGQAFYTYTNELTVAWWFRRNGGFTTGAGIGQGTIGVDSSSNNVWLMHGNGNDQSVSFFVWDGSSLTGVTSGPMPDNTWVFAVGTINASQAVFYVDGVSQAVSGGGITGTIRNNASSTIALGQDVRYNSGRFLNGDIGYVRVWNRALSAGEVATLYAQTSGCFL